MRTDLDVPVQAKPLSAEQRKWLERAWSEIDAGRLAQLDLELVQIPSPTGEEREVAEFVVAHMENEGLEAWYQPIDYQQGNAVGRLRGQGNGPSLLLYAPLDTFFSGQEDEDVPWAGLRLKQSQTTDGFLVDGSVVGLGAENPKAFVTCVVSAAEAVARAGVPLKGDLLVGLGAGGMPTNRRPSLDRYNAGQGNGCSFLLEQGVRGDFAIIAKPGYAVSWEEVGICWFRIQVKGTVTYVGTRHNVSYTNAIVQAAKVIEGLEAWFPEYTARHSDGQVAPQGHVGAIEGGWTFRPSYSPAVCNLYVDLRIGPRTDPMQAKYELGQALAQIVAKNPGLELDFDMILSIPGSHTDPESWIVQSVMRAQEDLEKKPYVPRRAASGATDAEILRGRGIPTVRIGLPRAVPPAGYEDAETCSSESMRRLTECLVYAIVDTCTRDRSEVGLPS